MELVQRFILWMGDVRTMRFYEDFWHQLTPLKKEEGICHAKNSSQGSRVLVAGYPTRERVRTKIVGQIEST